MSKLISVDELKEWIKNWFDVNRYYHPYSKQNNIPIPDLYDILERMPSAQQWIPCSERLPEDFEDVLVWFEYFRYGDYNRLYQTHGIGDYSSEFDSWMINHESGWSKLRVFAWMPLPEPWKEGEADGNQH